MEEKIVEGEVVGGAPEPQKTPSKRKISSFFHPLSGVIILGFDWLVFGLDWASGFLMVALLAVATFGVVFAGVSWVQRRLAGDDYKTAALKALIGALAAGIPLPITGTVVGGAIIALSGLSELTKLIRRR